MSLMKAKAHHEAKQDAPSSSGYQPCRHCHGSTPLAMLSQYGGLCNTCFRSHCNEGFELRNGPKTRDERVEVLHRMRDLAKSDRPSRQWAIALRDREHRGEKLTAAQRTMWRAALGREGAA